MKISTAALVKFPDTVYNPPPPPPPPLVPDRKQSFEFDSVLVTNGTLQQFSWNVITTRIVNQKRENIWNKYFR